LASPDSSQHATRPRTRAPREILEATQAVLLEAGVEGLSIRKVSERCGYSAPTIYHHFGDKRGLVDALLEERFRAAYEAMAAIPRCDDPVRHLREMSEAFIAFALENPTHYQLLMEPGISSEDAVPSAWAARALVRDDLEELSRRGSLATPDIDAAFHVLWAMLHGLISLEIRREHLDIPERIDELVFRVVEAGLLQRNEER